MAAMGFEGLFLSKAGGDETERYHRRQAAVGFAWVHYIEMELVNRKVGETYGIGSLSKHFSIIYELM